MKFSHRFVAAAIAVAGGAAPAAAHHSFAMFDASMSQALVGTVKEFQFVNPHAWIYLNVADASGKVTEWEIECGGAPGLRRQGWTPTSLKPGDKVTVNVNPMRNGTPGGAFISLVKADGTTLGDSGGNGLQRLPTK